MFNKKLFALFCLFLMFLASSAYALPSIALGRSSGSFGTNLTIAGSSFNSTDNITAVYFSGTDISAGVVTLPCNITAGGDINGTLWFLVPLGVNETYSVSIFSTCYYNATSAQQCLVSSAQAATNRFNASFTINPMINLSKASGYVDENITIYGYGFRPNESYINVTFGGRGVHNLTYLGSGTLNARNESDNRTINTVNAATNGTFVVRFVVPKMAANAANTNVTVYSGNNSGGVTTAFQINPKIYLNTSYASYNDIVIVIGVGFNNSENVNITFGNRSMSLLNSALNDSYFTKTTDANGTFFHNFTVPLLASQVPEIARMFNVTTYIYNSNFSYTILNITPRLTINETSGPAGKVVKLTGTGFAYGETVGTIKFNTSSINASISSTTVLANGSFRTPLEFEIPYGFASALHYVNVTGSASGYITTRFSDSFTITPKLTISANESYVGTTLTVHGWGFNNSEYPIQIKFNNTFINDLEDAGAGSVTAGTPDNITADANGRFDVSFIVPSNKAGYYAINASRNESSITYSVVSALLQIKPNISASAYSAGEYTNITVYGKGFASGETATATIGGASKGDATVDAAGSFTLTINVTAKPGSTAYYDLDVSGTTTSAGSVENKIFIYSSTSSNDTLEINKTSGYVNDLMTIYGSNFDASESVTILFNGTALSTIAKAGDGSWTNTSSTVTADSKGAFMATFLVPASENGNRYINSTSANVNATFTLNPHLILSSNSGFVGDTITILGHGFEWNESVSSLKFDGVLVSNQTTLSVLANGSFDTSLQFTITNKPSGEKSFSVTGSNSSTVSTIVGEGFTVRPKITLNASSGAVGSLLLVSGTGFASGESVTSNYNSISALSDGTFINSTQELLYLVANTSLNVLNVTVTGTASGNVTTTFTIRPQINITQLNGAQDTDLKVGDTVILGGTGFNETEVAANSLKINGTAGTHDVITITNGYFSNVSYTVPYAAGGIPSFSYGSNSIENANNNPRVNATLYLDKARGNVDDTVTIKGYGFLASEAVTVKFSDSSVASTTANTTGGFTTTFTVPTTQNGSYAVDTSGTSNPAAINFTIIPKLTLSKTSGNVNDSLSISGRGFKGSVTVAGNTTAFNGIASNHSALSISSSGSFDAAPIDNVPNLTSGNVSIAVYGITFEDTFIYSSSNYTPKIILNLTAGSVNDSLIVFGSGFNNGETGIRIKFNGQNVTHVESYGIGTASGGTVTATSSGAFKVLIKVPDTYSGAAVVNASGASTLALAENGNAAFSISPKLYLNVSSSKVNETILLLGKGFRVNESVNITYDGAVINMSSYSNTNNSNSVIADEKGSFNVTFAVPKSIKGNHTIDATGGTSNPPAIELEITSSLSASPNNARSGSVVSLSGTGFSDSTIYGTNTITLGGKKGVHWNVTPSIGSFNGLTYLVPTVDAGAQSFTVQGVTFAGIFTAGNIQISLSKTSGRYNDAITAVGTGFTPGETVTIIFDSVVVKTTSANSTGGFTTTFYVPAAAKGTHTVDANGSTTLASQVTDVSFTIMPKIVLTPSTGYGCSSESISIVGYGFTAGTISANSITINSTSITHSAITVASNGSFTSTSLTLQALPENLNNHTLVVQSETMAGNFSVVPSITISPSSGENGTITATGCGFASNEIGVNISFTPTGSGTSTTKDDSTSISSVGVLSGGSFAVPSESGTVRAERRSDTNEPTATFTYTGTGTGPVTTPGAAAAGGEDVSFDIKISAYPSKISLIQGESKSVSFTVGNNGKLALHNVKLTIEGWSNYAMEDNLTMTLEKGAGDLVKVKFITSNDSEVGDYNITLKVSSTEKTTSVTFIMEILPTEETTKAINQSVFSMEAEIKKIADELAEAMNKYKELNWSAQNETLTKINALYQEALNAVNKGDYKTAYTKQKEIESLIKTIRDDIASAKESKQKEQGTLIRRYLKIGGLIGILVALVGVVYYMWLPQKKSWSLDRSFLTKYLSVEQVKEKLKAIKKILPKRQKYVQTSLYESMRARVGAGAQPGAQAKAPAYEYKPQKSKLESLKEKVKSLRRSLSKPLSKVKAKSKETDEVSTVGESQPITE